jgi:hypothetical protein
MNKQDRVKQGKIDDIKMEMACIRLAPEDHTVPQQKYDELKQILCDEYGVIIEDEWVPTALYEDKNNNALIPLTLEEEEQVKLIAHRITPLHLYPGTRVPWTIGSMRMETMNEYRSLITMIQRQLRKEDRRRRRESEQADGV